MALGPSAFLVNGWLDALCNNTSFVVAQAYVKLHIGDPGAAGTANASTETTRKAVSFGAASGGAIANDTVVTWTGIAGSQDSTHFSLWDNISAGNYLGSGLITANTYTAGDTYNVAIGGFTISLPIAA